MYALVVTIQVQPEHREEFIKATLDDARGSIQNEPNCLRFDVLQDLGDPNRIHLYEVYKDQAAVDAHRAAPHFTKWRETCADWFDGEIIRRVGSPVYPPDASWTKRQPIP